MTAIIGMVVCFGVTIGGILVLGGKLSDFIDLASVLITVIPTIAALFIAFPMDQVLKMPKHMVIILTKSKYDPVHYIGIIKSLAEQARSEGLISLEHKQEEYKNDTYLYNAIGLVADAVDAEVTQASLETSLEAITKRHMQAWALYERGAAFAPAFGMVGTLISLVNMLMNLNFEDASGVATLGTNMSMAMITTFYGSLMANVIFAPIGNRLKTIHQSEILCREIIMEGAIAMLRGSPPRIIVRLLADRLPPKMAAKLDL